MKTAVCLQVLGAVLLAIAGALVYSALGFGVAGVLALVFGIALEREGRATTPVIAEALDDIDDGDG